MTVDSYGSVRIQTRAASRPATSCSVFLPPSFFSLSLSIVPDSLSLSTTTTTLSCVLLSLSDCLLSLSHSLSRSVSLFAVANPYSGNHDRSFPRLQGTPVRNPAAALVSRPNVTRTAAATTRRRPVLGPVVVVAETGGKRSMRAHTTHTHTR